MAHHVGGQHLVAAEVLRRRPRRCVRAGLCLLLLILGSAAAAPEAGSQAVSAVAGFVLENAGGAPIEGASVVTSDGQSTRTDNEGFFFLLVPPGDVVVHAHANGFARRTQTGLVVNEDTTVAVSLPLLRVFEPQGASRRLLLDDAFRGDSLSPQTWSLEGPAGSAGLRSAAGGITLELAAAAPGEAPASITLAARQDLRGELPVTLEVAIGSVARNAAVRVELAERLVDPPAAPDCTELGSCVVLLENRGGGPTPSVAPAAGYRLLLDPLTGVALSEGATEVLDNRLAPRAGRADISRLRQWFLRVRLLPGGPSPTPPQARVDLVAVRASVAAEDAAASGPQDERTAAATSGASLPRLVQEIAYLLPSSVRANRLTKLGNTLYVTGQDTEGTNRLFAVDLEEGFQAPTGTFVLRNRAILRTLDLADEEGASRPVSDLDISADALLTVDALSGRLRRRDLRDLRFREGGPDFGLFAPSHTPGLLATNGSRLWILERGRPEFGALDRVVEVDATRFERRGWFLAPHAWRAGREIVGLAWDGALLWLAERSAAPQGHDRLYAVAPRRALAAGNAADAVVAMFDLTEAGFAAGALSHDDGVFAMLIGDRRVLVFSVEGVEPPPEPVAEAPIAEPGAEEGGQTANAPPRNAEVEPETVLAAAPPPPPPPPPPPARELKLTISQELITSAAPVDLVFSIEVPFTRTEIVDDRLILEGEVLPIHFVTEYRRDATGRRYTFTLRRLEFPPGTSATYTYAVLTTNGVATADIIIDIPPR
ncbi:MAG: carboxypeptidase regulatory-like domain-containing protein [Candidatus Tectomicrobia bacterium]|nr:carboxypeptidase regulatory-like domain-containing protein [Candidatus Tectomicrobia bacterium]